MRQFSFLLTSALIACLFASGQSSAAPAPSAASAAAANSADYAVKLDLPMKVGDKFDLVAGGSKKQTVTTTVADKQPHVDSETFDYQMSGVLEALAVDGKGQATKVRLTVGKVTRTDAGKTMDIVPAGTVVQIESNGGGITITTTPSNVVIPIEGVAVFEAADLVTNGSADDDSILGTSSRQKVGASWDMNAEAGTKDMKAAMGIEATGMKGKMTLNKVSKVGGVDCLEIGQTISCTITAMPGIPPRAKIDKSEFNVTGLIIVPANPAAGPALRLDTGTMSLLFNAKMATPDGNSAAIQMAIESSSKKSLKAQGK
jgi:hypothetical protein